MLVCRSIMPLADRLSLKFHICPRSFASRPIVYFSDNLPAAGIILRHTSRLKGVYLLNILEDFNDFYSAFSKRCSLIQIINQAFYNRCSHSLGYVVTKLNRFRVIFSQYWLYISTFTCFDLALATDPVLPHQG